MKKIFKLMLAIISLLTISCSVWAQAGKDLVTYTIDGGTFHHKLITIKPDPKAPQNGAYSRTYLKLSVDNAPANDITKATWSFALTFNKAGTGTAKVNDPIVNKANMIADTRVYFLLHVDGNGETKNLYSRASDPDKTPGTITITKFGPVGGTVEGTFEGKLKGSDGIYTITGGHFVVTRKL